MSHAGEGPAQLLGYSGMAHGESPDMHLIDDGVGVAMLRPGVAPLVAGTDHQTPRHVRCRIEVAGLIGLVVPEPVQTRA